MTTVLMLLGTMALFMVIGVPISLSLGAATLTTMLSFDVPIAVIGQRMFTALDSVSIMAIPFFVLAGDLMATGGISRRLCDFANRIVGNFRGGMAVAMIVACALFSAVSGSAPATVVAIGAIMYPEMVRLGYPPKRAAGLLAVAGGLGPIIPPGIILVVYATLTNCSVGDMFKSATVWGALITAVLIVMAIIYAHKEKWPKNSEKFSFAELGKSFVDAIPALLVPVVIFVGIFSGWMTPTEAAAASCVCAFVVGMFVYRELKWSDLVPILLNSSKNSAMVLFIIATSTAFSWLFTFSGASDQLVGFMTSVNFPPLLFVFVSCLILQFFGTFLEGIATAVLLVPVLWPIAAGLGVNVIHFGMVLSISNVIGTMDPPVAVDLFAASTVSKLKVGDIAWGELPFYIAFVIILWLSVFLPQISTFVL